MTDAWVPIAQVAVLAITALAGLFGTLSTLSNSTARRRGRLRSDAEVLANLPPDSEGYRALKAHVEAQISDLILFDQSANRSFFLATLSGILSILFTASSISFVTLGGWALLGLVLLVPTTAGTAFLTVELLARVPRDVQGNRLTLKLPKI